MGFPSLLATLADCASSPITSPAIFACSERIDRRASFRSSIALTLRQAGALEPGAQDAEASAIVNRASGPDDEAILLCARHDSPRLF